MPTTLTQTVAFGGSRAGLTTVGYRLIAQDGTQGQRTAVGVTDLGDGVYGAAVTFPDDFRGWLKWDTGGDAPLFATVAVNPEDGPLEDTVATEVSDLGGKVDALHDLLTEPGVIRQDVSGGVPPVLDTVVRAGIPALDGCPVLTRLKAFFVDQGVCATLEHVFRDRVTGLPANLSGWLTAHQSMSASVSALAPAGTVKLRVKEFLGSGYDATRNPVWEQWGEAQDPAGGVLRAQLTPDMVEHAGIYDLNWAVVDERGRPVAVDRGLLSVERSLFPVFADTLARNLGPPTLQEVRMGLRDSSAHEGGNMFDDVEFGGEEIALALAEPVRLWNESPPPIERYTTRDFPYRGAWLSGVKGQLHLQAANFYRRARMATQGGGVQLDDRNKEREYLQEGQRLWQEYTSWMLTKKVEHNLRRFSGAAPSPYAGRSGW